MKAVFWWLYGKTQWGVNVLTHQTYSDIGCGDIKLTNEGYDNNELYLTTSVGKFIILYILEKQIVCTALSPRNVKCVLNPIRPGWGGGIPPPFQNSLNSAQ